MAFDRQTHKLWAGDVGQDLWEEVDIIEKGGNYGWNVREGFHPFKAGPGMWKQGPPPEKIVGEFIDPIFNYHHRTRDPAAPGVGNSITGGGVYRGKEVPELFGAYLFADYVNGHCYALSYDEKEKKVTSVKIITADGSPPPPPTASNPPGVFSFGEDEAGEMYFMTTQGVLNRFRSAKK
jgi:quinoprotein glucose dehydrogenase